MIRLARYVVSVITICSAATSQGQDDSPHLFASDHVLEIEISIAKRDWTQLRLQGRSFESALSADRKQGKFDKPFDYSDASVAIDGAALPFDLAVAMALTDRSRHFLWSSFSASVFWFWLRLLKIADAHRCWS